MTSKADQKILDRATSRFKQAYEADQKQRERERDDLRFQVPEYQWDDASKRERQGAAIADVPTPPRPIISINKLQQPMEQIFNQERGSHLGVNIHPLSPDADDDTAEVEQGLYRSIERDSNAAQARSWAFQRAVMCGRGYYRINTVFDDDGPDPFDQVIRLQRILHQNQVYWDPAAQMADNSDAEWVFICQWIPLDTFERQYPEAKIPDTEEFNDPEQSEPLWIRGDGEQRAVLVAEHFYKEHNLRQRVMLEDGTVSFDDEIPEGAKVREDVQPREYDDVKVRWCKLTGIEVLDEEDWPGRYLPIVTVIGRELQPFDDERRWSGVITAGKQAQRTYNYAASSIIEVMSLIPKAPWLIQEGQISGYEGIWQQANTRNFPVLPYKPVNNAGTPAPPPQRIQVDASGMTPALELLQQADDFIQSETSTFTPSLGKMDPRNRSGRAIQALQQQTEQSNSHFLFNLADISMQYEARAILNLMPRVYDKPGRVVRIIDAEDETSTVMLNQPYAQGPQGQMMTPQQLPQQAMQPGRPFDEKDPWAGVQVPQGYKPLHYDLQKGAYSVSVNIGKSYTSRLQQGAEEIGQILQSEPNLMPLVGPIYFNYRDFPGSPEIAKILKKVQQHQFPFLAQDDDNAGSPEQMQAENQALKQQVQQQGQALQQAQQAIQTDQAKQQATMQKAQLDSQTKIQIAGADNQTQRDIAQLREQVSLLREMLIHGSGKTLQEDSQAHEVGMAALGAAHAQDQQAQAAKTQAAMALPPFTQSASEPLDNNTDQI